MSDKIVPCFDKVNSPGVTRDNLIDLYSTWAHTYDQDHHALGWAAVLRRTAERFVQLFPHPSGVRVLDIGAGTGLMAAQLVQLGFKHMDALDMSMEMLNKARQKRIYEQLYHEELGAHRTGIENDSYDGVIGTGVFGDGQIFHDCFPELIRITKPGGYILFILMETYLQSPLYKDKFEPEIHRLCEEGEWELEAREIQPNYHQDINGIVYILKVK